ncbi:MAG: Ldh family oxidoreductase [Alphaproteobacteria bacterium]
MLPSGRSLLQVGAWAKSWHMGAREATTQPGQSGSVPQSEDCDVFVVAAKELEAFLIAAFKGYGATDGEAKAVSEHLVTANLTGHDSHGVLRAPWYMEKIAKKELLPGAPITVENETPSSAIINGHWGFGQPPCLKAMELCLEKAQNQVIACVTVRNANHVGRIGAYTEMAAERGMVGMGGANLHGTSDCVAPFGGIDRRLPTNPMSIAFPSDRVPSFLLDMTTSIVAEGKLQLRRNRGEKAPEGWIIDHAGNPTDDPWAFYNDPKGALMPVGGSVGYKGYGLSMAMDGLSGGLSDSLCSSPEGKRHGNACWFIAIRIDAFAPLDRFTTNIGRLFNHVKSSRPAPGVDEVLVPGEPEHRSRQKREIEGLPLDDRTWAWLGEMAGKVGVTYTGSVTEVKS